MKPAIAFIVLSFVAILTFAAWESFVLVDKQQGIPSQGKKETIHQNRPGEEQEDRGKEEPLAAEQILIAQLSQEEIIGASEDAILRAEALIAEAEKFLKEQKGKKPPAELNPTFGKGDNIKGVYMTGLIAAGQGDAARRLRDSIENLVLETELNAVVIDVKEADGPYFPSAAVQFIEKLKQSNIWTIARIVVFADASLMDASSELYLKTKDGNFWRDAGGRYWLDPASPVVQEYIIQFSKEMIDIGFDELQYDYIRFPTDGNLQDIAYPAYDTEQPKSAVVDAFSERLVGELRRHKDGIVLSADLFGLVATQHQLAEIGQSIDGMANHFDYLSFMLYPSHFYGGFVIASDSSRNLPYLYYSYINEDVGLIVSNHPYDVVFRSVLSANDDIARLGHQAKVRPWLQDFSLKFDTDRGIIYDAVKVRAQIDAAEQAGSSGWLLWNPANNYTVEALK